MKHIASAVIAAVVLTACQSPLITVNAAEGGTKQGFNLTVDVLDDTDIAAVQISVTQVDCVTGAVISGGFTSTVVVDYEDMLIPGANTDLAGLPYDAASGHMFADHFFFLPPGCYDVVATPLNADGKPSRDCARAHAKGVQVFAGSTTEILLIMQCRGEDPGALDVIASINHPPTMTDLQFQPSKFSCDETVTVCVSASDPDDDPLSVQWNLGPGGTLVSETVTTTDGVTTACATIAFPGPGDYFAQAVVYDMGYDTLGNLVTIESLLATQGDPTPSHTSLRFPMHILSPEDCVQACACEPPYVVTPAGDGCVLSDTVPAVATGVSYQVCAGDQSTAYGWQGARYPGGTYVPNSYWGQGGMPDLLDGRLNDIGVWTCDAAGGTGTQPVNEWIGFSVCLDIATAGDYLIGAAADNRMRFFIDGTLVFSAPSGATTNFNAWWMTPVSLSSGVHIIEIEGLNDGSIAAFGGEIAGPFAPGSLSSDAAMIAADYANNIVFSTGNMIGQPFTTGESSGWSCPDGYSVNTCGPSPECTRLDYRPCE